jgi:hypothetical protein
LSSAALPQFLAAGITGAVTAAVVIATAWAIGWPRETPQPVAKAETTASAIEALSSRLTELESRAAKPAAPVVDPARLEGIEKSIGTLRNDIAAARSRADKLAADLDAAKSRPAAAADAPDLAAIEARLAQLERASSADSDKIAQAASKPADDTALRRLVVASMLDLHVRQGESFTDALAAAKTLAADPQTLKPLDDFAKSGVPNQANLSRELLTLVPKLTPPAPESSTTGSGVVDRLKSGAAKLVRIERTDVTGNDRGAIVARATAAAIRNDVADTRRELNLLEPADRAPAQGWLDKVAARDAALSASRRFATDAMAALAKPAQLDKPAQLEKPAQ